MHGSRFQRTGLNFNFTLDSDSKTSAGVFSSSGVLVKTIWRNVRRKAKIYSYLWDGLDDNGNLAPQDLYTVKVLQHNIRYDWRGIVGNTSSTQSGSILRSFFPLQSSGDIAWNLGSGFGYMVIGPNEGQPGIYKFATSDPNAPLQFVGPQSIGMTLCAMDGTNLYYANTGNADDTTTALFVSGWKISDDTKLTFSSGSNVTVAGHAETFSAFDVHQKNSGTFDQAYATAHAATGLAVQLDTQGVGNLLAVSHGPDNQVLIFNKATGASVSTISITAPGQCAFDSNGDLWIISGTSVFKYTNLSTTPSTTVSITGLTSPQNVSCHPSNANIVVIADGGSSQQLKQFNTSGVAGWTYGQSGGYNSLGPAVPDLSISEAKFQWAGGRLPFTILSDGSMWICDGWPNRLLHLDSSRTYLSQVAWIPQTYISSVDENNPVRLFIGPLEYQFDYSKPILPGDPYAAGGNHSWKLVNNWAAGLDGKYIEDAARFSFGPTCVSTLSNNRTYALLLDWTGYPIDQVIELTSAGVRECGVSISRDTDSFYPDGSLRQYTESGGNQYLWSKALTGFDGSGNPTWGSYVEIAHYTKDTQTPIFAGQFGSGGPRFPQGSNGTTFTWNSTTVAGSGADADLGMHLGGVKLNGTSFVLQASPTVSQITPFDDKGSYQLGCQYTGSNLMLKGRDVLAGFSGEFWNASEACQFFHFDFTGIAKGGFGTTGDTSLPPSNLFNTPAISVPGMSGNATNPAMAVYQGETYLYHSDEANSGGLVMWKLTNSLALIEHSGSVLFGGAGNLTRTTPGFPTALQGLPGSTQVVLSWIAVSGASSYNVKQSSYPGGPYTTVATPSATSQTVTGLTNDQRYFFAVSAVDSGVESANSDEITIIPIDTSVAVHNAGQLVFMNHFGTVVPVSPSEDYPLVLLSSANILGTMFQNWCGSFGYVLYEYPTRGGNTSSLPAGASITPDVHWVQIGVDSNGDLLYRVNGVADNTPGCLWVSGNPTSVDAKIVVDPGDLSWYILTIVSPSINANPCAFTVSVKPHGLSSPTASQSVSMPNSGKNVFTQFLVKGAVDIVVPLGAVSPTLKGIFLDLYPSYRSGGQMTG